MKSIKLFSLSLLFSVFILSVTFAQDSEILYANADFKVNATCGSCKAKIEKALLDKEGVQSSDVDISTFLLSVSYDESLLTKDDIIKTVADAGYIAEIVGNDSNTLSTSKGKCSSNTSSTGTKSDCCSGSKTKKCSDKSDK
jgi:copper chaperone CopZ